MVRLMKPDTKSLKTSWTRVAQLKNLDDQEGWREFYELYCPLINAVALQAGLHNEEAEEVVQETMLSVSKNIKDFDSSPKRGSFRAWLLNTARWRIKDQFRKRLPVAPTSRGSVDGSTSTSTVERAPDLRQVDLESLCDQEWLKRITQRALNDLQIEVKAEHFQIFHLLEIECKSIPEVAKLVDRNRAQIYLIKHRVGNVFRKILRRLETRLG